MKLLFSFIAVILFSGTTLADSPLTSTPFSDAYASTKMVTYAKEKGYDKKVVKFLAGKKSIIEKLAVINSFGFSKDLATDFEAYLIKKRKGVTTATFEELRVIPSEEPTEKEITKGLTADDLVCWAYMIAMQDYNKPQVAMKGAFLGHARNKNSMAHAVPYALISGQVLFDIDWCQVYRIPTSILVDTEYTENKISAEALKIITDYIDLYAGDCETKD